MIFGRTFSASLSSQSFPTVIILTATDGRTYLCVQVTKPGHQEPKFHRKRTGLSHIAFQVQSAELVDQFVSEFLEPHGIAPLYRGAMTPAGYPAGYYAVYFEDPDRIKVEVVHENL